MNVILLSSEIVRRVRGSKDSVTNLETLVRNLIHAEAERSRLLKLKESVEQAKGALSDMKRHRTED